MFDFDGNLKFVNVDLMYLKHLHKACSEVFYKPDDYDNKPYIGLFVSQENRKYVILLTSAKNKHKTWKDSYPDRFLIYAFENKDYLPSGAIYNEMGNGMVKHILSAVDIKKMIPVNDTVISFVDFKVSEEDSNDVKKYKDLLDKEYSFCVKISDSIKEKASRIYDKQMTTGKVMMFGCDFRILEEALDSYPSELSVTHG